MSDYEKKEADVLSKIASAMEKLEADLEKIDALNADTGKKHAFKKWIEEKKAMHEIKRILHKAGKYEKFDEKEIDKAVAHIESLSS